MLQISQKKHGEVPSDKWQCQRVCKVVKLLASLCTHSNFPGRCKIHQVHPRVSSFRKRAPDAFFLLIFCNEKSLESDRGPSAPLGFEVGLGWFQTCYAVMQCIKYRKIINWFQMVSKHQSSSIKLWKLGEGPTNVGVTCISGPRRWSVGRCKCWLPRGFSWQKDMVPPRIISNGGPDSIWLSL